MSKSVSVTIQGDTTVVEGSLYEVLEKLAEMNGMMMVVKYDNGLAFPPTGIEFYAKTETSPQSGATPTPHEGR